MLINRINKNAAASHTGQSRKSTIESGSPPKTVDKSSIRIVKAQDELKVPAAVQNSNVSQQLESTASKSSLVVSYPIEQNPFNDDDDFTDEDEEEEKKQQLEQKQMSLKEQQQKQQRLAGSVNVMALKSKGMAPILAKNTKASTILNHHSKADKNESEYENFNKLHSFALYDNINPELNIAEANLNYDNTNINLFDLTKNNNNAASTFLNATLANNNEKNDENCIYQNISPEDDNTLVQKSISLLPSFDANNNRITVTKWVLNAFYYFFLF
jgi:hypothetical protein